MGFRKDFKKDLVAKLSILEVIDYFKSDAFKDQNGKEIPLKSEGTMTIRCPKPTHKDSNPSCTINITDTEKNGTTYKANTGICYSCPDEKKFFTSLDLAIQWIEYTAKEEIYKPVEKGKIDRNYYKKVEKVFDIFEKRIEGLDRNEYYEHNTDYQRSSDYVPFFSRDELNVLGINSFIEEENKRNIVHHLVRLEDYVNHSLRMSGKQEFVDKQIKVSDFFYKDPKRKIFVFTDKDPDEKQKVFLTEARNLLLYYNSENINGTTFLDFTYKDMIKNEAFENATEKIHEAFRHKIALGGIKGECGFSLEEIANRRYRVYFDNVTKNQNTPLPVPDTSYQSVFLTYGERKYNQYTYSATILLDKGKGEFSHSAGVSDEKHFPESLDEHKADFRYSTEKSNVPLFQSEQEYNQFHSIYTSLVNNYNSYLQRYFQLVKENSHTYFTVKGEPFIQPVYPETMQEIANNDSILSTISQQRNEIMQKINLLIEAENQKVKEYASEATRFLKAKDPQEKFTVKNGNLYSKYIESAEDLWKQDKEFFESLIADRIATVREECNRRIDKCYAQTTVLAEELRKVQEPDKEKNDMAVRYYLRYCELQKQNAVTPNVEQYRDIIERGKIIYSNNIFLNLYSKDIERLNQRLDLVKSVEEKLNKMQGMRDRKEEKEISADMPEQTGVEQE